MIATLVLKVPVDASVEQTWLAATDWAGQGGWMLGTTVRTTHNDGQGVGGAISAFTGLGRIGFVDPMTITRWEPPHRCHVLHTGKLVRGTGAFEVEPSADGTAVFVWREDLVLPFGVLGRLGWLLLKPIFAYGVLVSLKRFARWVPTRNYIGPTHP